MRQPARNIGLWHAYRRRVRFALRAGAVCALLVAPALASREESIVAEGADAAVDELVVPPGQEELISAMLGRGTTLPDGCKFAGGTVDGSIIRSTYTCPSGQVVVELTHASNAAETATQTEDFAITVQSGAPPEELTDVLASLIRSREPEFAWVSSDDDVSRAAKDDGAP
jgi:hypothetical protein